MLVLHQGIELVVLLQIVLAVVDDAVSIRQIVHRLPFALCRLAVVVVDNLHIHLRRFVKPFQCVERHCMAAVEQRAALCKIGCRRWG